MNQRNILIYLAIKHEGNWLDIMQAIEAKEDFDSDVADKIVAAMQCNAITILDKDYPKYLLKSSRPPFVLFYYGDITLINDMEKNLSVVGSRKYTEYGRMATIRLVERLCKQYNIVSGLAVGIDSIAQKTCIENGGKTIAVLGSGIDNCYPPSNKELYEEIKKNHLLLSEFPGVTEPCPGNFPIRNRIIAALSKATLMTEARPNSGSCVTAGWALENNRDVMCGPNTMFSDSGCNKWIKEGAYLVESVEDVLEIIASKKCENI